MPGSNPRGRQRWRRRRRGVSDTCVARARRAVGSAAGRLRTPRPRCRATLRRAEGSGVWGGGAGGARGVGRREGRDRRRPRVPCALGDRSGAAAEDPSAQGGGAGDRSSRGERRCAWPWPRGRSEELTKEDGPLACGEAESPGDPSRKAAPLLHAAVSYSAPTHPPVVLRLWARHWGSLCPSHSPTAGPLQHQGSKMIL